MERLTGIRRLYHRGSGQSRNYRARMNSWSYGELQRQIEYKARWEGVRVVYVPARNTSKRCSICGYKTLERTQRQLWCPHCGTILDRDENAARNIAAGGLRFSPNGPPGESNGRGTGTGERDPNPQSRWRQARSTSKSINQFDRDLAEPENASHVMLCPDDMLLQDYSWRRFALWFPEFNPVAFGIDDPSEFAVFVFLSLIVDFHAFPFELIQ